MDLPGLFAGFLDAARQVWRAGLFPLHDHTVTLGQVISALLLTLLGVWAVRRLCVLMTGRLLDSKRIDRTAANAIQKLATIVGVTAVLVTALATVGIPMTAFTVMSGALAIGFGFGAQQLIGNLTSGLWIMIERPMRIGDLIEVGEHRGQVVSAGIRCTSIRRIDGVEVLIPNNYFITNEIVNWTHQDHFIRGEVLVGIAYGSDTALAKQLLLDAARSQPKVLQQRRVEVFFEGFGESSLDFALVFWCEVTMPRDLREVSSDLRFAIDAAFREHGVSISFPQRDVHLDTRDPLQVELRRTPDSG